MSTAILCLVGPTAAGKSASVLELARRWPIEVINVDSATIYRGMDIGTAKPSLEERRQIAHHLLDIRDPAETYSAAAFREDALSLIQDICRRGRTPVLCGGTMLYYKALREGLSRLPPANPAIRAEIDDEARKAGWPAMHARLAAFDPLTAARLAPNDSQRVQRAIEVYRSTGRSMSSWHEAPRDTPDHGYAFVSLSLEPSDRRLLHERISRRYHAMLELGLLAEVAALHRRGDLHTDLPSVRCVGYRQLWEHLDGRIPLTLAVEQAIAATRQLAKRQLTWLRAQPDRHIVDCLDPQAAMRVVDLATKLSLL